jgi:hypothetical protein
MGSRKHKSRRWPALRRVLFAALVLALSGGLPLHTAEAQTVGSINVQFSYDTLPIAIEGDKPVLCQGQTYKILAQGVLTIDRSTGPRSIDEIVTATGTLNPVTPDRYRRLAHSPMVIFYYNAKEQGQDAVEFGSTQVITSTNTTRQIGSKILSLVVRECTYKVSFVMSFQVAQGAFRLVQFGLMAETRIEQKEDGTLEGGGTFAITGLTSTPPCVTTIKDFETLPRITGKLLPDSREVELNFDYGKGKVEVSGTCPVGGGQGSSTWDISPFAPRTVRFPQEGGSKSFPVNPGAGRANLTIIVNREVTNIAR